MEKLVDLTSFHCIDMNEYAKIGHGIGRDFEQLYK